MKTPGFNIYILPGSFLQDTYFRLKQQFGDISVRIDVRTPAYELRPESSRRFALPVTETKVYAGINESYMPLGEFVRPLRVTLPFNTPADIEKTKVRYFDSSNGKWADVENVWLPGEGKFAVYLPGSGAVALTQPDTNKYQSVSNPELKIILTSILQLYEMPSLSGKDLNPTEELTIYEGVCNILDIIPYDYQKENVLDKAIRAGILLPDSKRNKDTYMRRDEAIYAIMMVYRKKTGHNISGNVINPDLFYDYENIKEPYREAVAFAYENGIVTGFNKYFRPDETITRGELLIIIGRVLMNIGEI
jgi:hypothetical protein